MAVTSTQRHFISRLRFVDALRGIAILSMILNHTEQAWLTADDRAVGQLIAYLTMTIAAPLFLFISGFSLPLSWSRRLLADRQPSSWMLHATGRSLWLVILGYLLNCVLFPGHPLLLMGPLQTIGLGSLILIPMLPWLASHWLTALFSLLAFALHGAFMWEAPTLNAMLTIHPSWGEMFFFSVSFWPWVSLVILGAVIGAKWCACSNEGEKETVLRVAAWLGVLCVLLSLVVYWIFGYSDYTIHFPGFSTWYPGPVTALWMTGLTPILLFILHAWEKTGSFPSWLLTLGQHALLVYVVHRILVVTVMEKALDFTVSTWQSLLIANIVLVFVLMGLIKLRLKIAKGLWH